ncbi:MAG: hypothetical protein HUU25_04145 [Candidatus Sumerlaeia bacterium]|nr:hypothetical protein [Candidatus Sumerlaeia bacterium]
MEINPLAQIIPMIARLQSEPPPSVDRSQSKVAEALPLSMSASDFTRASKPASLKIVDVYV